MENTVRLKTTVETLLEPLGFVAGVVERNPTLPVLGTMLLRTEGRSLAIRGTDLESEAAASASDGVDVEREGSAAVAAGKLVDIWRSLPRDAPVEMDLPAASDGPARLLVKSGRRRFQLATVPAEDFPAAVPTGEDDGNARVSLDAETLALALDRVKFAMARGDVRYYLNGALVEFEGTVMRLTASDGQRMASCAVHTGREDLERRAIIPRKTVLGMRRMLARETDEVSLEIGETFCRLDLRGEMAWTSKLVAGQYPDVSRLFPSGGDMAMVDRDAFRLALLRTSTIIASDANVAWTAKDGSLTLTTRTEDMDEAVDVVPLDAGKEPRDLSFLASRLREAFDALPEGAVKVVVPKEGGVLFESPGDPLGAAHLILPART